MGVIEGRWGEVGARGLVGGGQAADWDEAGEHGGGAMQGHVPMRLCRAEAPWQSLPDWALQEGPVRPGKGGRAHSALLETAQTASSGPSPHVLDVQAAGSHVCGHQHSAGVGAEPVERSEALALLHACSTEAWRARAAGRGSSAPRAAQRWRSKQRVCRCCMPCPRAERQAGPGMRVSGPRRCSLQHRANRQTR